MNVTPSPVHILQFFMKGSLSLLVTPSGESARHQSSVTLTSSEIADGLFREPGRRAAVG